MQVQSNNNHATVFDGLKVWIKVKGIDATKIELTNHADVDDLKNAIKKKMSLTFNDVDAPQIEVLHPNSKLPLSPAVLIAPLVALKEGIFEAPFIVDAHPEQGMFYVELASLSLRRLDCFLLHEKLDQ